MGHIMSFLRFFLQLEAVMRFTIADSHWFGLSHIGSTPVLSNYASKLHATSENIFTESLSNTFIIRILLIIGNYHIDTFLVI